MRNTTIYILITAFLLTSCGLVRSDQEDTTKLVEFTTLFEFFETETPMHEFETIVLANTSEVDGFLSQFPTDDTHTDLLYSADYTDSLILGVFVGSKPNASYSVNIDSVVVNMESSLVYITETGSAEGFDVITWPAHFIIVSNEDFNPQKAGFPYKRICHLEPCEWPVHTVPANTN